ncbi:hypothetical protein MUN81_00335 [Hymenobacter sp. 5317J-9]|uniref:hypothetical protein n=1 Tax=Hymenobacter sp. 5317J-9 TaxID=2932250 RepID=UPI001FD63F53|nr:hypothetical protein [Hymenobacter sp. 5317J-9]UOQ97961.1 hypothetical protein MUN81_00335 [Hymenobacter sp. 5317J-9]
MKKSLLSLLAAGALLASCETKHSETKDQLAEAGQDTAVMARDGQTAADMAAGAANSADNAWDLKPSWPTSSSRKLLRRA